MSSENTSSNSRRDRQVLVAASALTALLLALSFPPVGWGFLAWVAFVPMLVALRGRLDRFGWLGLSLAGWGFGISGFFWVRHVTWLGVFFLGFYIALYFVAFAVSVRWLSFRKGLPLGLSVPLTWTALEAIRGVFLTGLPWLLLAHTQYKNLGVIQVADFAGAAGVTFWMTAVNGIVADGVCCLGRIHSAVRPVRVLAAGGFVLALTVFGQFYGSYRLDTIVTRNGPAIAVVQGNIPQEVKNEGGPKELGQMFSTYVDLTRAADADPKPPKLVIWPETMTPPGLFDPAFTVLLDKWIDFLMEDLRKPSAPADRARGQKQLRDLIEKQGLYAKWRREFAPLTDRSAVLVGAIHYGITDGEEPQIDAQYNSVFFFPRRAGEPAGRYDKIHLVPFGEYIPLQPWIGWLVGGLVPYSHGLSPGSEPRLFEIDGWRFGPTICFEDAFPALVADFGRGKKRMDFIVNITNEGWFKDGAELDEHLAIGVFRAIECRAGFVRAANTGISAFIAPTGRILSTLTVGGKDREVSGILHGVATTCDVRSPYLSVGELFAKVAAGGWALCLILYGIGSVRSRRRKRSAPGGAMGGSAVF